MWASVGECGRADGGGGLVCLQGFIASAPRPPGSWFNSVGGGGQISTDGREKMVHTWVL